MLRKYGETIFFLNSVQKLWYYYLLIISSKLHTTDQSIIYFECMVQDIWSFELLSTLQFGILLATSCFKYTCNCVLKCVQYLPYLVTKHP